MLGDITCTCSRELLVEVARDKCWFSASQMSIGVLVKKFPVWWCFWMASSGLDKNRFHTC